MPTFSSGPILNSGLSPSTALKIMISNDDPSAAATIELEVFLVSLSAAATPKIPYVHQLFSLYPLDVTTKTIDISGVPAYETQLRVTSSNIVINLFATDAVGNMNAAQRLVQAEQSIITAITPVE
ncbi:hypothetical protein [Paenibacillus lignilyticus]|uniref:Uncharacterized protein n=1 Tax=Paenibacillus lignilyticus TaxID=1172615 RepID=A0ABS5CAY8_9BACL|nr:hypothetical protein [Paenibacillus lignilyticus]MBP3962985.1 hypothetical protein [Paenibacillus lignilyticus]